jgi:cytochrome c2
MRLLANTFRIGLVLAISAVLTIVVAVAASLPHFPLTTQRINIDRGARLFHRHCASCHAVNADEGSRIGPSLHRIGQLAATRVPDLSAEEYIFQSILDPNAYHPPGALGEMPEAIADNLPTADLINMTAFLTAQGGQVRYHALHSLSAVTRPQHASHSLSIDVEATERGRLLFFGKLDCSKCHSVDNTPGNSLLAPSLARVGLYDKDHLRQAILEPDAQIATSYVPYSVNHKGRIYTGRLLVAGAESIRLLCVDSDGAISVHDFNRDELEPLDGEELLTKSSVSSMPSYRSQLSDDELESLLEFLATLR